MVSTNPAPSPWLPVVSGVVTEGTDGLTVTGGTLGTLGVAPLVTAGSPLESTPPPRFDPSPCFSPPFDFFEGSEDLSPPGIPLRGIRSRSFASRIFSLRRSVGGRLDLGRDPFAIGGMGVVSPLAGIRIEGRPEAAQEGPLIQPFDPREPGRAAASPSAGAGHGRVCLIGTKGNGEIITSNFHAGWSESER